MVSILYKANWLVAFSGTGAHGYEIHDKCLLLFQVLVVGTMVKSVSKGISNLLHTVLFASRRARKGRQ